MSIYDVSKKCKLDVHVYLEEMSASQWVKVNAINLSYMQNRCHVLILDLFVCLFFPDFQLIFKVKNHVVNIYFQGCPRIR